MNVLSFVIVGHVDHGKSTLIGRLLYDTHSLPPDKIEDVQKASAEAGRETEFAFLLDHLEEERKQGITIDTTQVFFKTDKRRYVIIDAPGHVEFVKNMITGASQAEAAVLIIDVTEGVKEQTKRHSYMLSLLGLRQVVVVLNKMDLVDFSQERFDIVTRNVADWLKSISIEPTFYIPISAIKGDNIARKSENMPWYTGLTFLESLHTLQNRQSPEDKPLLMPIQDVYKIGGKRISVGRVESGIIEKGAEVKILPTGQITKITWLRGYGNTILIDHKDGYYTVYAHLGTILVREGQIVEAGEVIARVGQSGTLEGPRLHFEIWAQREKQDPLSWLVSR